MLYWVLLSALHAAKQGKVRLTGVTEQSFIIKAFTYWKDATRVFRKHESCDFHKQAVMATNKVEVEEMFLAEHAKEKKPIHLLKLLSTVCYLAHPVLPLVKKTQTFISCCYFAERWF